MESNTELKRITADLTPEAYEVLSEVAKQLHTSKADVLRRSLGLINFLLKEKEKGYKLILESQSGSDRKEIVTL